MLLNHRYRVVRLLGEGGFGKTFLAEDTQMPSSRSCVIKQLKPIATHPDLYQLVQERFQREAVVLETLGEASSQIPRLYAYFSEAGLFYLVQEWVEGATLDRLVQAQGPLDEHSVRQLLLSLLPVLAVVHQHNIIHRDIKPENIILRQRDQQPVLIDFGAVREVVGTVVTAGGTPQNSIVIGTPGFMPSEQAIGRPLPASDLYSLGLTAIYLLTGKNPLELLTDAQTGEILWQTHAPHLSSGLATVLHQAIRSHPRDRYSSAQEMLAALNQPEPIAATVPSTILPQESQLQTGTQTMSMAPSQPAPAAMPQHQPSRSPVLLGSLIAAGLISAAILAGFFLTRSPRSEQFSSNSPTPASAPSNQSPDASPAPIAANSPPPARPPESPQPIPATPSPTVEDKSQPIPPQDLILKAASTGGQVSVYAEPSGQANSPHYGVDGDRVTASRQTQDNDGPLWYFVEFASGAAGWVRSDFVQPVSSAPKPDVPQPGENTATFPQTATLTGTSPGSRVNVRSSPSTQANSPSYGLVGDRVTVLEQTQGADGHLWYRVRFASGAEGWVRGDFVQLP